MLYNIILLSYCSQTKDCSDPGAALRTRKRQLKMTAKQQPRNYTDQEKQQAWVAFNNRKTELLWRIDEVVHAPVGYDAVEKAIEKLAEAAHLLGQMGIKPDFNSYQP